MNAEQDEERVPVEDAYIVEDGISKPERIGGVCCGPIKMQKWLRTWLYLYKCEKCGKEWTPNKRTINALKTLEKKRDRQ